MKNVKTFDLFKNEKQSIIDPSKTIHISDDEDAKYTKKYTQEKLTKSNYSNGENKVTCPLCKKCVIEIDHTQTKRCPNCSMEMTNYGNALICKIDNEILNLYKNINKYNI